MTDAVIDTTSPAAWAIGGIAPGRVVHPADAAELATAVADVAGAGEALVPLGRGAHRALGHAPSRYDVALVTDRLATVRDYQPADMTVTVEAGVTLAALATVLTREQQWLPLDPALPADTTIGGLLAADLAGPLAGSQGRVRDFVIGITAVTATGVVARAGGRVVKNVAGYDLMKLYVGSLGTLAVITEATFKVRPRPAEQRCLVFAVPSRATALAFGAALLVDRVGALSVTVTGAMSEADGGATVIVRLGGVAADVAVARTRVEMARTRVEMARTRVEMARTRVEMARTRDAMARTNIAPSAQSQGGDVVLDADADDPAARVHLDGACDFVARAEGDVVARLATLPLRLPTLLGAALAVTGESRGVWQADPLRGVAHLAFATTTPEVALAALATTAAAHGAHLVVERWPTALASHVTVWQPLPPALPLMTRMKRALDPAGTLAPGRFIGRI
ncbi:MAG: FAD-binding oxidoreductase [Candidatus Binatia bacterium]